MYNLQRGVILFFNSDDMQTVILWDFPCNNNLTNAKTIPQKTSDTMCERVPNVKLFFGLAGLVEQLYCK